MIWRQIQWRLTLYNTLLMAVVVAGFAAAVYVSMSSSTWKQVAAGVDEAAGETAAHWQARGQIEAISRRNVVGLQIAEPSGKVLLRQGELPAAGALPAVNAPLTRVQISEQLTVGVRTSDTDGLLTTVAVDVTREEDRLEDLARTLSLATLAATLLSGGIGLAMAHLALRPIDRMSAAARRIALDPDIARLERLPLHPPEDELYRLGETFNAMLDRIEHSFDRQTQFVAHASHELRTPLTVIHSYTRLLTRWGRNDPAVVDEALGAMNREADRMGRLLQDLLLLARGDAGFKLEREPVEMGALLHELGRDLTVASESLGGQRTPSAGPVTVKVSAPDPAYVQGDPRYLRQLIMALADNALQYTPEGGQVLLSLDQQGEQVRIHVTDTGMGIPPQEQERIFDRFHRVDKDRARATGGSGLGLSIASWLAHMHNGSITCRSLPGEGSTFTVTLPQFHDGNVT